MDSEVGVANHGRLGCPLGAGHQLYTISNREPVRQRWLCTSTEGTYVGRESPISIRHSSAYREWGKSRRAVTDCGSNKPIRERCGCSWLFTSKARRQTGTDLPGPDPILCHLHQPSHNLAAAFKPVSLPTNDGSHPSTAPAQAPWLWRAQTRSVEHLRAWTLSFALSRDESPRGCLGGSSSEMSEAYLGGPGWNLQVTRHVHRERASLVGLGHPTPRHGPSLALGRLAVVGAVRSTSCVRGGQS